MEQWKNVCDGGIACLTLGVIAGLLPAIAALLAIVLTAMRIVIEWAAFKAKILSWFQ